MSREYAASGRINLIWHLLFFDMLIQFFRLGGIEVVDIMLHGIFLSIAAVLMLKEEEVNRPPLLVSIACTLIFAIGLIQLIPLNPDMMGNLAPIKDRIMRDALDLFPFLTFNNNLTFIPDYHLFRMTALALDICLVLMVTSIDKPSARVVRFWILMLGFSTGLLTILGHTPLTEEGALLGYFQNSHGGFINRNHFSTFSAIILVLMAYEAVRIFRSIKSNRRHGRSREKSMNEIGYFLVIVTAGILILMENQSNWSRSAVLNMAIGAFVFGGFLLLEQLRGHFRQRWWIPVTIAAPIMVVILFMPMGRGVEKLVEQGVGDTSRVDMWRVGMDYVSEGQFLGTGIGSTVAILNPVLPRDVNNRKNARRFHNDFIQILVEFGPGGFLALMLLMVYVLQSLWLLISSGRREQRLLAYAVAAVLGILCFHSMIDFPLRMASIRTLALIFILYGVKEAVDIEETCSAKLLFFLMLPLLLYGVGYNAYLLKQRSEAPYQNLRHVETAYRYGEGFKVPFHVGKADFSRVFTQNMDLEATLEKIKVNRERFAAYMHGQPFSTKAMNYLLMMDVIEYRVHNRDYVEKDFLEFERQALGIQKMGKDSNFQARSPLFFLYSAYEPDLDEARKKVLEDLRVENDIHIRSTKYRLRKRAQEAEANQ